MEFPRLRARITAGLKHWATGWTGGAAEWEKSRFTVAVAGSYIAWRARTVALPHLRAYTDCARELIVPLFAGVEQKADQVAQAEYERLGAESVGEDFAVDMGDLAERAHDVGLTYYETMVGIRQSVLNLLAVGLFHLIEQELADLCRDGAFTVETPTDSNIEVVAVWYRIHFLLDLHALPSWATVDELRLEVIS